MTVATVQQRKKAKDKTLREHLDDAERSFDRAVASAITDYELDLIRNRLAAFLKEITPS